MNSLPFLWFVAYLSWMALILLLVLLYGLSPARRYDEEVKPWKMFRPMFSIVLSRRTCVHGVIFVRERPLVGGLVRDIMFVPLGVLVQFVARFILKSRAEYPAMRGALWMSR